MKIRTAFLLGLAASLGACGGGGSGTSATTYVVSATVSGLAGTGLALTNNGSGAINVTSNGPVTIANGVAASTIYLVAITSQPTNPSQTCSVANGSGTVATSNVSNITISCVTNTYGVGGQINGLVGTGLIISNSGSTNLPVSGATYSYTLASGTHFSLAVSSQPTNPSQTCAFVNMSAAAGTVGNSAYMNADLNCTTNSYTVGGNVSGLTGTGLALRLNAGPSLPISGNGPFSFSSAVLSGLTYAVTVAAQPTGTNQTCDVAGGAGTAQSAPVANVVIVCGPIKGFAYVANSASTLSAYSINGTTGALSPLALSATSAGGPYAFAVTPNSKFLFVADLGNYTVSAFSVDSATGALTAISGSPFATVSRPWGIAVDPSGKFLYVSSSGGTSNLGIAAYTIDSTTGALAPIAGSPYAAGSGNYSVAITPNGQFIYVTDHADNTISGYALNSSTGVLTPLAGSPFAVAVGVYALTIHPSGLFLYAANTVDNVDTASVTAYAINSTTGALTSITGSPYATGLGAVSVALDPAGKFLYVANYYGGTVSAYTINQSTGALTGVAGSPFDTGAGAGNKSTTSVNVDPSGAFLYATNGTQENVSAFTINAVSGALTPVAGGPYPAASGQTPQSIITIP